MKIEKNNMKSINNQKGITLVALTITIIVLLILATITINAGKGVIKEAKLEELKTNMLLIRAKAKECVEEADFKLGPRDNNTDPDGTVLANIRNEIYVTGQGLMEIGNVTNKEHGSIPNENNVYMVTNETLTKWGLNKIQLSDDEAYFVEFNEKKLTVEVYNNLGFDGKYSLSEIEKIEL